MFFRNTALAALFVMSVVCTANNDAIAQEARDSTSSKRPAHQTADVNVSAERVRSAVGDEQLSQRDLRLLPMSSSQDVLRLVPGLVLGQHAGGGKAEQIFLRGFDCDHGTDISISVDGSPVNMVSHGHGQGYADLHYVIPEAIERIDVSKGPYYAAAGDQATAGVVKIYTADTLQQNLAKAEYGMFQSYRGVALLGSRVGSTQAYGGIELLRSRGYFDAPQDFQRLNTMLKVYSPLSDRWTLSTTALHFVSDWNASGQIPERAVNAGQLSPFGTVDSLEGGNTSRTTLQCKLQSKGDTPWLITAGYSRYQFQLFSNFSFFVEDPVRGDMIEQTDKRSILNLSATTQRNFDLLGNPSTMHIGASVRADDIHTALYHDQARKRLSTTIDAGIQQADAAVFAEQSMYIDNFSVSAGLRAQYFAFAVTDELTSQRRARQQVLLSPKLNAAYDISSSYSLYFNSGFGFHSNDARAVVRDSSDNVVPRAFGSEIGLRYHTSGASLCLAAWMLDIQSELVWIGDEGTTEGSGRTRRYGFDIDMRYELFSDLAFGLDACTARGRYRDEDEGNNFIALAPNLTLSAYCSYTSSFVSAALRVRHISDRPANQDNSLRAQGYTVVDLNASMTIVSGLELSVECRNLLNVAWKEAQFDTTSRLKNESAPVADMHFISGTPRNVKVGCQWSW